MKRVVKGALLAAGTARAISAAPGMPATAAAGEERDHGHHRLSAVPGTDTRTVIGSVVRARGVFRGVGRVVELSQPLGQDDLVFPSGTMHVVSALGEPVVLYQPPQLPVHRDAAAHLGRDRRHRAVRRRGR